MDWMTQVGDLSFGEIDSGSKLRATLSPLKNSLQFNWLVPVLVSTLDDFVADALDPDAEEPTGPMDGEPRLVLRVDTHRYSPFQFEQNLSVANDMINRLLSKRNEIFDLEAQALRVAIAYCEEAQLMPGEEAAVAMAARADAVQAGQPFEGALAKWPALRSRTKREILNAKLSLHNHAGSSLNYGEQISLMRKIYADNVRILTERMHAVREFLSLYGVAEDEPEARVPDPRTPAFLEDAVWWIRRLVEGYEETERTMERSMVFVDVIVEAGRGKSAEEQAGIWNGFLDTGEIEFDFTGQPPQGIQFLPGGGTVHVAYEPAEIGRPLPPLWLVGLSASVAVRLGVPPNTVTDNVEADRKASAFAENAIAAMRGLSFPISVTPPTQLDHKESSATVDLGMVPLRVNEPASDDVRPIDVESARRFSPLGRWRVKVGPASPDRMPGYVPEVRQSLGGLPGLSIVLGVQVEHD